MTTSNTLRLTVPLSGATICGGPQMVNAMKWIAAAPAELPRLHADGATVLMIRVGWVSTPAPSGGFATTDYYLASGAGGDDQGSWDAWALGWGGLGCFGNRRHLFHASPDVGAVVALAAGWEVRAYYSLDTVAS